MALPEYRDLKGRAAFLRFRARTQARLILFLALVGSAYCPSAGLCQPPTAAQSSSAQPLPAIQELFTLTNQARAEAGVQPVKWDPALAAAALNHCLRMSAEGPIAHRYRGEPEVAERAAQAGAHFSLIAENVAVGPYPAAVHQGWLDSPGHRANMLNPNVDSVGIGVVTGSRGTYAVADFSRAVTVFSSTQAEDAVAQLLRARRLDVLSNRNDARAACTMEHGVPSTLSGPEPRFVMRWQDADLGHLPPALVSKIATGDYRRAAVASCPAHDVDGSFTIYRLTVLLYGPPNTNELKPFY